MSKKNHSPGPVPPGNRSQRGGHGDAIESKEQSLADQENDGNTTDAFQTQDPKRRFGGFEEAGEHSRQQPGRANDGDTHSQ
jgi:hypothetical protein